MSKIVESEQGLLRAVEANPIVIAKFSAQWCGPCKALVPLIEKLSADFPQVTFVDIDVDQAPLLAAKFQIRSVPTLMAWKGGVNQWTKIGVPSSSDFIKAIQSLL